MERLYYQDPYMQEFSAQVVNVKQENETLAISLDRTAFYPEGGGQGADHGTLLFADGHCLRIIDVQESDGEIWHMAEECGNSGFFTQQAVGNVPKEMQSQKFIPQVGDLITGQIDWNRRFDHMQQHSGEHIVSGMICSRFHCNNVGFHLGEDMVTIDFDTRISMEQALEIETEANKYIWENHAIQELWPSREELDKISYRSKKELEGDVRLIAFPGADICACCGTHVSGSAQVGLVKFLSAKNFHDGTRLELLCGARAYAYLSGIYSQAKGACVLLSSHETELADHVKKLLDENRHLKDLAADARNQIYQMKAENCREQGDILAIEHDMTPVQIRELADLIAQACGGTAAVFSGEGEQFQYSIIHKTEPVGDLVKKLNSDLHGRGGGKEGFAQGSVAAPESEIRRFFSGYKFI